MSRRSRAVALAKSSLHADQDWLGIYRTYRMRPLSKGPPSKEPPSNVQRRQLGRIDMSTCRSWTGISEKDNIKTNESMLKSRIKSESFVSDSFLSTKSTKKSWPSIKSRAGNCWVSSRGQVGTSSVNLTAPAFLQDSHNDTKVIAIKLREKSNNNYRRLKRSSQSRRNVGSRRSRSRGSSQHWLMTERLLIVVLIRIQVLMLLTLELL